ncbi:proteoglycan 4-like [Sander lucioperca]|uniref:proteoglycan 4-like n=1 Tax=Sander lucioperca TaxID=283035 RepID=UPI00125DDA44|nr:proteoglycan 4-like [Sander lucioperca]
MFKTSSVLLLTLVLNVQLCSSAPIPAKAAQSSGPGPEKLAPVTEDHSHFKEEKEPVQEKLIPVVAGVAAPSPEESPAEEDIPVTAKEPEPIFIGDQVSDDADKADESQESAPQEPLAVASQESSEEGTFHEEAALQASPEETTEEVALAAAVESEQHYGEDSAPEVLIPVIPLEASKAPEENAEEETAVAIESAPLEQYDLEDPVPGAPIPIIPAGASEDEASVENAAEEAAPEEPLLIVPDEVEPAALPMTPAEEKSVLVPAEFEESAPEEPAVIVPVEPAEQELDQEETVSIISSETKEEEAPEENAKEEEAVSPVVLEENAAVVPATNEEPLPSTLEESVALFPVELEIEEEGQVEHVAEQTAPQESAPGDPVVVVPLDPAEDEPELEVQVTEESIPIASPESPEEEAPEEAAGVPVPIVPEENAEEDPATNEEPFPSTLKEEESVALFPVEFNTEEEGQVGAVAEQTAPQESAPEEPAVIVPLEPAKQDPDLEEQEETVSIMSSETKKEEAPEEHAKEEEKEEEEAVAPVVLEENAAVVPATNEEPLPSTLEESVALFPVELEIEEEGQVEPVAEQTAPQESAPEDPVVVVPLDPAEDEPELEVQVTEESIPIASPESPEEEAPEEAAGVPVPIVPEENAEEDPATNEEPLAGAPEEEKYVVLDTEEEVQVEQAAEETEPALEKPAVSVVVEPTSEEPAPEDPIVIIPLEDLEEDAPDDNTEDVVHSDPLLMETALEEDTAGDSDAEILVTQTSSENDTIETALDPGEEVAATEVPASTEILTEAPIELVTAPPAPAVSKAQIILAPLEGGDGTSMKTRSEDFRAVAILIEDEPVVLVNRGTVLGAAFFTLMSFIVTGFLGTTIYKKLR